jgi:23S rRNA pseudouridine2605 synthase
LRRQKTLERVLSKAGLGSRSEARSWVHGKRVRVNGKVVEDPDLWIDLDRDHILFDGKPLESAEKRYLLLYKPKGYITTYKDPDGRPTVYDLFEGLDAWVFPVGRLDLDTSGLLVLTNDSGFAELLTNPHYKVPKTYQIKCCTRLTNEQMDQLRNGVELDDGKTRPAIVKHLRDSEKYTFLEMTITEGRNRQVRRMVEAIGSKVLKLVRTAIGKVKINDLQIGKYRELTPAEIKLLTHLQQ